jgi:hypothetical protein
MEDLSGDYYDYNYSRVFLLRKFDFNFDHYDGNDFGIF